MARCLLGHTTAFENENSTAISRHTHPRAQQYKKKTTVEFRQSAA